MTKKKISVLLAIIFVLTIYKGNLVTQNKDKEDINPKFIYEDNKDNKEDKNTFRANSKQLKKRLVY